MDGPLYWPSDKNVLLLPSYKEETMFLCCPLYLDLHKYHKRNYQILAIFWKKKIRGGKSHKKTFIFTNLDGTAQMSKERKRTNKSYMTCYFEL